MTSVEKKKRNNLIIMMAVALVLVVALVAVKITSEGDEGAEIEDVSYDITSLKTEQVAGVSYDYKDGSHAAYVLKDGSWYNADDLEFPLSGDAFSKSFVDEFVNIKATKKIDSYEGDISQFGLTEPEIDINITSTLGGTTNYKLGNHNPTYDLYYLMINNDDSEIYMVDKNFAYICRDDIYDYAKVSSFPGYSLDELEYIEFKSGDNVVTLLYDEEGKEEDISGYGWTWYFDKPFSRLMPAETNKIEYNGNNSGVDQGLQETVMKSLKYSKMVNYKATEEDMESYGLTNPQGSYSIYSIDTKEDGTEERTIITVLIGNMCEEENGYYSTEIITQGMTVEKSQVVNILDATAANLALTLNPLDYIYSNGLYLSMEDIDGSYILINDGQNEIKIGYDSLGTQNSGDDLYYLNDEEIDGTDIKALWYAMVSLKADGIIKSPDDVKEGEPTYTIYSKRNKDDFYGDISIKFIKYDASRYQVEVNGVTDLLMQKSDVDNFFKAVSTFIEENME